MDSTNVENFVLQPVFAKPDDGEFVELNELQLAYVGGGIGNTII
jgi:hypothetical protein